MCAGANVLGCWDCIDAGGRWQPRQGGEVRGRSGCQEGSSGRGDRKRYGDKDPVRDRNTKSSSQRLK